MSYEKELGVIGKKIGMTHVFDEEGNAIPVTVVQITENIITDIKTKEKHGYNAVQIGNLVNKESRLSKPMLGNLKKKNLPALRKLQEFRTENAVSANLGDSLNVEEFFKDLPKINVTGTSIGKGFQGGIKRHNMTVGRRSHGSKSKRIIGSLGAGTTPGRVFPGKRMASMMGNAQVTITKTKVVKYDPEQRILLIKGPVPGKKDSILTIKPSGIKSWNYANK